MPTPKKDRTATPRTEPAAKAEPTPATPERATIPARYRWNTTHLFATDEEWERERKAVASALAGIAECKGKLKAGKARVRTCLERLFAVRKRLARLANYAHRLYDQDTRVTRYQGLKEVIDKLATEFLETTSFVQPELLSLPTKTLQALIAAPELKEYDRTLKEVLRLKPHILTLDEEKLLASATLMRDTGYNAYSIFSGADLAFPTINDEEGKPVQLTQSLFTRYRASPDRRVRKETFDTFFSTFQRYKNTLATLLGAQINAHIVYAKAKKYGSALEAALDPGNVPTAVYHNMVRAVNKHLPLLHRYLKLRQKLLGLKDLRYYDLYPPMIDKVEMKHGYDAGRALVLDALSPMGTEYLGALKRGLDPAEGWIDPYPNQGKRSGAYMDGSAYDVHPFVLLNYLDDYSSVSTLAHEMGHAMHSFFSNKHQPFPKADYSIFVAEVASTLNEALLMRHMLSQVRDPKQKLYLLGERLEDFRQTVFRQAMFAEFELALYDLAEKKEALTADAISKIYLKTARRYYGHAQGVVLVDDLYGIEWAYVPHFYYNFYVYQYVTGMTASTALAEMIVKQGEEARARYVTHLLKAGDSDFPVLLLQRAGVDLTSTQPYDVAMQDFATTLAQAEELVQSLGK